MRSRPIVNGPAATSRSAPRTQEWEWRLRARCRGEAVEVFFAPDDERGTRRLHREWRAKQICRSCPVLELCRAYAINAREPYGIWGAMTPTERRRLLARRDEVCRQGGVAEAAPSV